VVNKKDIKRLIAPDGVGIVLMILLLMGGCSSSSYDQGYDDGYDGASPNTMMMSVSKNYKYGYHDGQDDQREDFMRRKGCNDAEDGYSPQHGNDTYMNAYDECK
jgi:hypothetical protein